MRAIIVEDEALAVEELISSLKIVAPYIHIVAVANSIAEAIKVIENNTHDLIFMDIHLGDGDSFEIFKQAKVESPVIFITAHDTHSLKAFHNQGIGYILKPFSHDDLAKAISKLSLLQPIQNVDTADNKAIKERFIVNVGPKVKSIKSDEIAYFMADGKYLYLYTFNNNNYLIEQTISKIINNLSPTLFFQINRKFIISFDAIVDMVKYPNNRIKITLNPPPKDNSEVIVSADRVIAFRQWLNL